ncbi:hypothetical protein NCLIV_022330 [Neospora caninum Liverpool]|uniref:Transmembrane protein n=1 Tax=Neospora caninum (strain Liverpool) TaxID=572307 RepID=F0VFF0_NEOCL|nr:hypothetical protein NCLIV_022330 [Neospora caninum Liverpool]CBZ52444.1 hypothetical protein NCLIV_022330 [Neospora caninum Liverpool]CEL66418.1 TPA: hypothetical protein BN1204_022330 [Neospora caninum Liverpool]|eukprot:XP_003882476.1 hypothetical protein NCLIV_022330 [Neospora caninum Liverpool]
MRLFCPVYILLALPAGALAADMVPRGRQPGDVGSQSARNDFSDPEWHQDEEQEESSSGDLDRGRQGDHRPGPYNFLSPPKEFTPYRVGQTEYPLPEDGFDGLAGPPHRPPVRPLTGTTLYNPLSSADEGESPRRHAEQPRDGYGGAMPHPYPQQTAPGPRMPGYPPPIPRESFPDGNGRAPPYLALNQPGEGGSSGHVPANEVGRGQMGRRRQRWLRDETDESVNDETVMRPEEPACLRGLKTFAASVLLGTGGFPVLGAVLRFVAWWRLLSSLKDWARRIKHREMDRKWRRAREKRKAQRRAVVRDTDGS